MIDESITSVIRAASVVPVYTRDNQESAPVTEVSRGCFECEHGNQFNPGRIYTTLILYSLRRSRVLPVVSVVISEQDRWYTDLDRNNWVVTAVRRGVRDEYVSIDAMYRQVSLFTRKYAIFDEVGEVVEERHNHNRLNITEYLDRIRDEQGTFRGNVLVGSFNTGQLGLYLEPTVNFRGRTAIPRESVPNTMAFARDYWGTSDGLYFLSDYFEQFDHNGSGPQLTRLRVDNAEELAEDQGSYDVVDDIPVRTQTMIYDDMTAGRTFRPSTFTTSMWLTEMGSNDTTGR